MISPNQVYSNIEDAFKLICAAKNVLEQLPASEQADSDTTQLAERLTNMEGELRNLADHAYDWKFSAGS